MKVKLFITTFFVLGLMLTGVSVDAVGDVSTVTYSKNVPTIQHTQTLRRGTRNSNVLALQTKLKEFGFYHKALDSDYGSGTIAAVKTYQAAKGLVVDGVAGPKTYAMILSDNLNVSIYEQPVNFEVKKEIFKAINNCLHVEADSTTSPAVVGGISQEIAVFEVENTCDSPIEIDELDFQVISPYSHPEFDDIVVQIDGNDFDDTVDTIQQSYNQVMGGNKLFFGASDGANTYTINSNETVDIAVIADVFGYTPWTGASNKSTAFAISLNDIDYVYQGVNYGWNKRPVWGNLIVVHYN